LITRKEKENLLNMSVPSVKMFLEPFGIKGSLEWSQEQNRTIEAVF